MAFSVRSIVWRVAILTALFAAIALLFSSVVPGAEDRLANASPGWVAAGIVVELVACAGFAACFAGCFSYDPHHVPRVRSGQIALGELAAFAIVPAGVAAPLLRFWALLAGGMPLRTIAVRSVVHGPILNIPYITAAVALGVGVVLGVGPGEAPLAVALAPIAVVIAAVVAAALLVLASRLRWFDHPHGWRRVAREVLSVAPQGIREIPVRIRNAAALGGAFVFWAADCAVLVIAFAALGQTPPLAVIVLAYMLGQLGNALPLPGGVGGVEPVMLGVLTSSGVDAGLAAAAIVVYRAIALGVQSITGALAISALVPAVQAEKRAAESGAG